MIIFKKVAALQQHLQQLRLQQLIIGFVPTMGALHTGHLTLVQQCCTQCQVCVVSIFVNPAQFNDPKDFEKYPITTAADCQMLEQQGVDILFLPAVVEMYPVEATTNEHFALGAIETILEGHYRPGHFQGVSKAVKRLLNIVEPHYLFMGQKDYQQCMVLKKLIELMNVPVDVYLVPTLRENSGLAMSSRNSRLSHEEKERATAIYQQLTAIKNNYPEETNSKLKEKAAENLLQNGFYKIDYVEIASAETLLPLADENKSTKAVALVAAFIGNVRLIDNLQLN